MSAERVRAGTHTHYLSELTRALDTLSEAADIDDLLHRLAEAALAFGSAPVVEIALAPPNSTQLQSAYVLHNHGDGGQQPLFPDIGRANLIHAAFQKAKPQIGFLSDLDDDAPEHHILAYPIKHHTIMAGEQNAAIGVLALGYLDPPPSAPDLHQGLSLLCTRFAFCLQRILSKRAAQRRKARIDLVGEIGAMVAQQDSSELLFNTAIRRVGEVYNFETAALYAGQPLTLRLLSPRQATHLGTPVPEEIVARIPENDAPLILRNLTEETEVMTPPWAPPQAQTEIIIPLTYRNRRIGLLDFYGSYCEIEETEDQSILILLGQQLALLIVQERQTDSDKASAQRPAASIEDRSASAFSSRETVPEAQQLQAAYDQLQEFAELKDQILQNISHELRTPLTLIKGYLELMMDGLMGNLTSDQTENLQRVVDKVDDVTRIVEGIVSLSPLNQVSMNHQRISMAELIAELALVFVQRTENTGITWDFPTLEQDLYLFGDAAQIRQVFYNILDNSVKFSPAGGKIQVEALSEQSYVHIIFRDNGVGIPQPRLTRIFETFYQVDGSSTRRFGGLGLGLAVVARVVRAHNGKVWAESELGKGSTFHVLLPKYRPRRQLFQPSMST